MIRTNLNQAITKPRMKRSPVRKPPKQPRILKILPKELLKIQRLRLELTKLKKTPLLKNSEQGCKEEQQAVIKTNLLLK